METNDTLASAPVLELHHLTMSMLEGYRGQLEIEKERENISIASYFHQGLESDHHTK